MMLFSVIRFWYRGWIEKLYLEPTYFFNYRYFEWVKPLGNWTYLLFALIALSSIGVLLGYKYRWSAVAFFLSFTYVELMDKTTYLNHYYFVSLLAFVLIWLPAGDNHSLDARGRPRQPIPRWVIPSLQLFVGAVYCYAGLAKLNSDWLLHAQPLSIWLPARYDIPLLGDLLQRRWVHYAFSWSGAAYDLCIPFLLLWRPTRPLAFVAVVIFHVLTRVLFPIGMFPYIMIVAALVFFPAAAHERWQGWILEKWNWMRQALGGGARVQGDDLKEQGGDEPGSSKGNRLGVRPKLRKGRTTREALAPYIVGLVLVAHLLLPWRYLLYPGELFWTESGYRFSWRVMLIEKAGYLNYTLVDEEGGHRKVINPGDYLTAFQLKQLATQPDFILEFAHYLADEWESSTGRRPAVYAESYVALNGRGSRVYVDPELDLTRVTYDTPRIEWLTPFNDEIYGL